MVSRPRLWWARLDWQGVKTRPLTSQTGGLKLCHGRPEVSTRLSLKAAIESCALQLRVRILWEDHHHRNTVFAQPRRPDRDGWGTTDSLPRGNTMTTPWHGEAMKRWSYTCPKEQLHNYPPGYIRIPGVQHRTRHKMLANS